MSENLSNELIRKLRRTNELGHWRNPDMNTENVWRQVLLEDGHVAFVLDGVEYFIMPLGPHKYGLNLWEDYKSNGGWAKWSFQSEDEVLNAKLFNGRSILERLDEILMHDAD